MAWPLLSAGCILREEEVEPTDLTIEILKGIRDEVRETNVRIDGVRDEVRETNARVDGLRDEVRETNARVDGLRDEMRETNARVDRLRDELTGDLRSTNAHLARLEHRQVESEVRLATELVAVAGAVREVRDLLRDDLAVRHRIDDHERRLVALESRGH
jgi:uncharacterized coiled-coil DUF342 family protein